VFFFCEIFPTQLNLSLQRKQVNIYFCLLKQSFLTIVVPGSALIELFVIVSIAVAMANRKRANSASIPEPDAKAGATIQDNTDAEDVSLLGEKTTASNSEF
jgi:hypothetical protein